MKKVSCILLLGILLNACGSGKALVSADKTPMLTTLDLVTVVNDKVLVSMDPGAFSSDQVSFYIPKTVPGTYSTDNYGKYIEGFKALDYQGEELTVSKGDENTWNISNGKDLDKIEYYVNDTYDSEGDQDHAVFSPAGTNIMQGEDFMLNLHGFVGYFDGLKEIPYELLVKVPEGLKATTSLKRKEGDSVKGEDLFMADRYFDIIDNPILYAKPNAVSFEINGITVNLSVYSPSGAYKATDLKEPMERMMGAQKSFLGDTDGTKEYNIILYLSTLEPTDASGFGALEHHTSTVVVLPEQMPMEQLEEAMVDVVSHEFFHIVTPLNVHSNEIQFFDYNNPKMSQHLWMYEGTTEYFANLFQIQQGLIDSTEFYQRIMDKINNSKSFDDEMSFTTMSKNILDAPYKENYANVYEKGALINMALDITLRELSGGEKGVLWLMKELSRKYGNNTPFKDEELIDEIVAMTYPEIRTFFDTYVIGKTPIDYETILNKVGLTTTLKQEETGYFLKGEIPYIDVDRESDNAIFVRKGIELNSFFNELGVQGGDVIQSINGTIIDLEAIRPIIGESFSWTPETEVTMEVQRGDNSVKLSGKAGNPVVEVETIVPVKNASEGDISLREAWMKG